MLTVPKTIASGENITIPSGRVAVLPNVQIDGTLNVQGDVFIPSGATLSSVVEKVTSTDNAIVRFDGTTGKVQNSGVIIDDSNNITTTGRINSVDSRINGNGFTGVFATDTSGIYTDVGNTNYRIYTGNTERMRIDSNGNVGIGTSGPVGNLDVFKTTSAISYVRTANQTLKLSADDSSGRVDIANSAGTPIGFTIGTTERMRIDSAGNVGIGVTPSAWTNTGKTIQFSYAAISSDNATDSIELSSNAYYNAGWKYIQGYTAGRYAIANGQHTWYSAPTGTTGNAITWTNAMTLAYSGNLLVGTATDNGVDKLQVNGSIKASNLLAGIIIQDLGSTVNLNVNDTIHIDARNGSGQKCFPILVASDNGNTEIYHNALFKVEALFGGGAYNTLSNSVQKSIIGYYAGIYYTNIQFRDEFFSHHQLRAFRITYLGNGSGSGVLTVKATGFGLYL